MERKRLFFVGLCLVMFVLAILVFCISPEGKNSIFNLTRIDNISMDMMKSGISGAPYWIYSYENYGYGYGGPLLYADLFLYIPSFLVYLGMKVLLSYKLFMCLILMFSGMSMFFCIKKISNKTSLGTAIASLYSILVFLCIEIFPIKINSDFAFFIFIPLVSIGVFSIIKGYKNKTDIIYLAIGLSGIIFSQIIIGIIVAIIILVIYLLKIKKRFYLILSLIFMIGITSYYVFPLIEQKVQTHQVQLQTKDYYKERGEVITTNHKGMKTYFERKRYAFDIKFRKNKYENSYMEIPLVMYKGYVAIDKETDEEYKITASKNGLVKITVNDVFEGDVYVVYKGTEIQNFSVYLSTISLMVLMGFVFWKKGDEKC